MNQKSLLTIILAFMCFGMFSCKRVLNEREDISVLSGPITCTNGVLDTNETNIDCGGTACKACTDVVVPNNTLTDNQVRFGNSTFTALNVNKKSAEEITIGYKLHFGSYDEFSIKLQKPKTLVYPNTYSFSGDFLYDQFDVSLYSYSEGGVSYELTGSNSYLYSKYENGHVVLYIIDLPMYTYSFFGQSKNLSAKIVIPN